MRSETKAAAHRVLGDFKGLLADMPETENVTHFEEHRWDGLKETVSSLKINLGDLGEIDIRWTQKDKPVSA